MTAGSVDQLSQLGFLDEKCFLSLHIVFYKKKENRKWTAYNIDYVTLIQTGLNINEQLLLQLQLLKM